MFPLSFTRFVTCTSLASRGTTFRECAECKKLPPIIGRNASRGLTCAILSKVCSAVLIQSVSRFLRMEGPLIFGSITQCLTSATKSPISASGVRGQLEDTRQPTSGRAVRQCVDKLLGTFLFCGTRQVGIGNNTCLRKLTGCCPTSLKVHGVLLKCSVRSFKFLLRGTMRGRLGVHKCRVHIKGVNGTRVSFITAQGRTSLARRGLCVRIDTDVLSRRAHRHRLSPLLGTHSLSTGEVILALSHFKLNGDSNIAITGTVS